MKGDNTQYGLLASLLHWFSALLTLVLIVTGFLMRFVNPRWQENIFIYHLSAGIVLAVIFTTRIIWMWIDHRPKYPNQMSSQHQSLYQINHITLYIFTLLTLLTGFFILITTTVLGIIGDDSSDISVKTAIEDTIFRLLHNYSAYILIFLGVIHVVGVLWYHYKEEKIMWRMRIL